MCVCVTHRSGTKSRIRSGVHAAGRERDPEVRGAGGAALGETGSEGGHT